MGYLVIYPHPHAHTHHVTYKWIGPEGSYAYTGDLLTLRNQGPQSRVGGNPQLTRISTPLHKAAWEAHLRAHPDPTFTRYIVEGIEVGFRIGVNPEHQVQSAHQNMLSAREHPDVIGDYIGKERAAGHILGPFPKGIMPEVQINCLGVIPKKQQTYPSQKAAASMTPLTPSYAHCSTYQSIKWQQRQQSSGQGHLWLK